DFNFGRENPYFNNKTVTILIKFDGVTSEGLDESVTYRLIVGGRGALSYTGEKTSVFDRKETFARYIGNIKNKASEVKLTHRNFTGGDESFLVLENLRNYKSFNVSVSVQKN